MNTLYNNIEIGDTISFPRSILKVKEGKVIGFKGHNQHAKRVLCENGVSFEISRYVFDYVVWDNN